MRSLLLICIVCFCGQLCDGFQGIRKWAQRHANVQRERSCSAITQTNNYLLTKRLLHVCHGKKDKGKDKAFKKAEEPTKGEKQGREDRFDAMTRKFMFTISGLNKTLRDGSKSVLKNVNLCFYPGAKIGVVGANGSGKSSLLKIMAGVDKDFDGAAVPMPGASIGYLPQEPTLIGETVMENIDLGVAKGQAILDKFAELSAKCAENLSDDEMTQVMNDLADTQAKIEAGDLWEIDRFKQRAMEALRCPPGDTKISILSGGERRRVALARLLLENHDLLLLDEPTNHLDAESVAWLEHFLQEFKGTVVAITHDRYFLENSCSWILELDRGEGIPYEGNYSGWLEAKQRRLVEEKRQDDRLQKLLASELEWVRSNPKARQTKSKARLTRYEELLALPAREISAIATSSSSIYIPPGPRLGQTVIDVQHIHKAYGDRVLIQDLSFSIPPNAIVGIVGPNGAGKSTLVKMLQGLLSPDTGNIVIGDTVKMAVVDQDRENLTGELTLFQEITGGQDSLVLGSAEVNSRMYCTWFGFRGSDQQKKVSVLSGGERNRVQLAKVVKAGANVLLLDEPTNDLDVDTIRALEEALLDFAGCVIIVSHDRYFLDRLCTHIIAYEPNHQYNHHHQEKNEGIAQHAITFFEGNYQEYALWKTQQSKVTDENSSKSSFAKLGR